MPVSDQETALIGVFADQHQAECFVDELRAAGFKNESIGVVAPTVFPPDERGSYAEEGAAAGALTGGTIGTLAGIGVAAGVLPAIGPVIAGGVVASVLASTATGAAAGGVLGALAGLGIPETQAQRYERHLKSGRTLVVVQEKTRLPEAMAILRRCGEYRDNAVTA
jgi:hypothetical protein